MEAIDRAVQQAGSVRNLARALNVVPSAITNWKRRGSVPGKQAIAIHRQFGIPLEELAPPGDHEASAATAAAA